MLRDTDIISVKLTKEHADAARRHAGVSSFGGESNIFRGAERQTRCLSDNVVGHLGQVALHLYLFGGLERYEMSRWVQNQFPRIGDGGVDALGLRLDVKTSDVRTGLALLGHRLLVRPKERHAENVYVLALLQSPFVHLIGWARDTDLPQSPSTEGVFAGAYVLPARMLHPLLPLRYAWLP